MCIYIYRYRYRIGTKECLGLLQKDTVEKGLNMAKLRNQRGLDSYWVEGGWVPQMTLEVEPTWDILMVMMGLASWMCGDHGGT